MDMALTMVLAYGTFLLGEELRVSPVIAVVVAGIYVGKKFIFHEFATARHRHVGKACKTTPTWSPRCGSKRASGLFL